MMIPIAKCGWIGCPKSGNIDQKLAGGIFLEHYLFPLRTRSERIFIGRMLLLARRV